MQFHPQSSGRVEKRHGSGLARDLDREPLGQEALAGAALLLGEGDHLGHRAAQSPKRREQGKGEEEAEHPGAEGGVITTVQAAGRHGGDRDGDRPRSGDARRNPPVRFPISAVGPASALRPALPVRLDRQGSTLSSLSEE